MKPKPFRCIIPVAVALAALIGLTWALAVRQPATAWAETNEPVQHPDSWYFKASYPDYAPSGVPDFDQRQDGWSQGGHWTHCGPAAAANSLWWFDSKFEPNPAGPPPGGPMPVNDHYSLVSAYLPGIDDHDPNNVTPFVTDLAWYFDTNGVRTGNPITGTNVYSMAQGIQDYIAAHGLADRYYVSIRGGPLLGINPHPLDMEWVYREVMKSEDVILLLGLYEDHDLGPGENWVRIGGHFVTVVGITRTVGGIGVALSDPIQDRAEQVPGGGRIGAGLLIPHAPIPHPGNAAIHNDAGNVSHDYYLAIPGSSSPGGMWWIPDYYPPPDVIANLEGANPHPIIPTGSYEGGRIHAELEYAIAVSPMFWKASYEDYAPSGVPDFDMQQDEWKATDDLGVERWTHDAPAAWADSFWWFDAKFSEEITRSGILTFSHTPASAPSVITMLAAYAGTAANGTSPISLSLGIDRYLAERGLETYFYRTTYARPPFDWVVHEVEKSEDVLLLIGFWQQDPAGASWHRLGGHWVAVAGVNGRDHTIAFSDPFRDFAEEPAGQGRVLPLLGHPFHPGDPTLHNDALYVSHDVWVVTDTQSPGGVWGPLHYTDNFNWQNFIGLNPHPDPRYSGEDNGTDVVAEVEYAVAVSPMDMFWKGSEGYTDYAPSGIPDFDQKQDNWKNQASGWWSYCGPVAAANSLWWFDSKFEPAPQTPQPGVQNDHLPLVVPYQPGIDDHDPLNVGGGPPGPAGPPGLVDELARLMNTDGLQAGTTITDLVAGLDAYLHIHGMATQFYTETVQKPTFEYVCDEVERSEDVVLLIGFWEYIEAPEPAWLRWGGHYVTVAGVDRDYRHIAFSDPYLDSAENLWSGQVLSGTLIPHYPPHPAVPDPIIHNDAGNVSHDIYQVVTTTSPGGVWGPFEYGSIFPHPYFEGQNGGMRRVPADPGAGEIGVVVAEVEYAVVVSPLPPDIVIHKEVTPTRVSPGDWVTFTLVYTNTAVEWAENVIVSDPLPAGLINPTWTYTTTYGKPITASDAYTWTIGRLGYLEGGVITITARVDPALSWPATTVITNAAWITTTTTERAPGLPNTDLVTLTVETPDLRITTAAATTGALENGDWLTFTLVYTNAGPGVASSVVITDALSSYLVTATARFTYTTSYGGLLTASDHYVWLGGAVPAGGWGVITVTAQITGAWPLTDTLYNAAVISAPYDYDSSNDQDDLTIPITGPRVYLPLVLRNY